METKASAVPQLSLELFGSFLKLKERFDLKVLDSGGEVSPYDWYVSGERFYDEQAKKWQVKVFRMTPVYDLIGYADSEVTEMVISIEDLVRLNTPEEEK